MRYLNSVGGGIVQRFIGKDMVSVLEDDGFETPTLVKECVVVENVDEKNNFPAPPAPLKGGVAEVPPSKSPLEGGFRGAEEAVLFEETPEGENLTVALAFVPQDVKKINDTLFDLYLVNDSNYDLYYSIATLASTASTGSATTATGGAIVWDLRNSAGRLVANGTYLVIAEVRGANGKIYAYSARLGVKR